MTIYITFFVLFCIVLFESFCRRTNPNVLIRPSVLLITIKNISIPYAILIGTFMGKIFDPMYIINKIIDFLTSLKNIIDKFLMNFYKNLMLILDIIKIKLYNIFLIEDIINIVKSFIGLFDIPFNLFMSFYNRIIKKFNNINNDTLFVILSSLFMFFFILFIIFSPNTIFCIYMNIMNAIINIMNDMIKL